MALILIDEDILEVLEDDHRSRGDEGRFVFELHAMLHGDYPRAEIENALQTLERGGSVKKFKDKWHITTLGRRRFYKSRYEEEELVLYDEEALPPSRKKSRLRP
jgi:hypothetical protein